jgi:hypothetical protein
VRRVDEVQIQPTLPCIDLSAERRNPAGARVSAAQESKPRIGEALFRARVKSASLGVWSKVGGAPFLCIEPWHGFAIPSDFEGEFADKPGVMHIAEGEKRVLKYRIGVG